MRNLADATREYHVTFCDCYSDAVLVCRWKDDECREIYLSMWQARHPHSPDWRDRLRQVWRIATVGYPYEDDVVLNPDRARELGQKLIEYADNWSTEEIG